MVLTGKAKGVPQLSFKQAGLDFTSVRAQLTLGFIVVFVLTAINFLSLSTDKWSGQITPGFDWLKSGLNYFMTNAGIVSVCSFFVALLSLELTGRYGNRLAAVQAIWSALIFNLSPCVIRLSCNPAFSRAYELNCLFALMTIYCLSRLVLLKEKTYALYSAMGILLMVANDFISEFEFPNQLALSHLASECYTLFFPLSAKEQLLFWMLAVSYAILGILSLSRLLLNRGKGGIFVACIISLLSIIYLAKPSINQSAIPAIFLYAAVPMSLLLSFLAFPPADTSKLIYSKVNSFIGLMALTVIVIIWSCIVRNRL